MSILKYERRTPKTMQEMYDYLIDSKKTDTSHIFGIGINPMYAVTEMKFVQHLYRAYDIYHPYIQVIFCFDQGTTLSLPQIKDICIAIGYCLIDDERQVLGAIHYKETDKVHCHYMINYVGIHGMLYRQEYSIYHYYRRVNEILAALGLTKLPVYEAACPAPLYA